MFLKKYILKFQQYMKGLNYSPRTITEYGCQLNFFFKYLQTKGILNLNQITKEVILNYQMSLFSQERPLSLQTQLSRLFSMKSLFKYLMRTNQILYDPSYGLTLPKRSKRLPKTILTKKEVFRLLDKPNADTPLGLRDKAMLEVLYSTGIRNQELRQLIIYDVNTDSHDLMIRQGKGKKDRMIPLGEIASNYVDEYIQYGRPKLMGGKKTDLLFISKNGRAITAGNFIWILNKYVQLAKIDKKITPHVIRHTFATHLLKNNASLRHIQELLGHASIETTQIYTQLEVSDLKRVHKKFHPRERDV